MVEVDETALDWFESEQSEEGDVSCPGIDEPRVGASEY